MPEINLHDTIELLRRTPVALDALLRDLPDTWTLTNEGGLTWRVFDIVDHLIHGERTNWMPRVAMILQSGETRTFESFDRADHEREMQGKSLPQLLDMFTGAR